MWHVALALKENPPLPWDTRSLPTCMQKIQITAWHQLEANLNCSVSHLGRACASIRAMSRPASSTVISTRCLPPPRLGDVPPRKPPLVSTHPCPHPPLPPPP